MSLKRFHDAQADASAGYAQALAEMRAGQKSSHWIWYIFPQLEGLGSSSPARFYAIHSLEEACDYLRDSVLRARYEEITEPVAAHANAGVPIKRLMGSATDALKLVSSLTLFREAAVCVARDNPGTGLAGLVALCDAILQRSALEGNPPCARTLAAVGAAQ